MPEVIGIDHVYISVSNLAASEEFYDKVLLNALGFRKYSFELSGDPHIQYFNRQFGYVIRAVETEVSKTIGVPGLHHFCFRVESIEEVQEVSELLRNAGIAASEAQNYPEYASDYWATFFADPDGVALEVTNYRQERRDRNERWESEG